jgi:hypothetical protein
MKVKQYVGMLEYLHFLYSSGGARLNIDVYQLRMAEEKMEHWWKNGCQGKIEAVGETAVLAPL